jgi:hypothetical protein
VWACVWYKQGYDLRYGSHAHTTTPNVELLSCIVILYLYRNCCHPKYPKTKQRQPMTHSAETREMSYGGHDNSSYNNKSSLIYCIVKPRPSLASAFLGPERRKGNMVSYCLLVHQVAYGCVWCLCCYVMLHQTKNTEGEQKNSNFSSSNRSQKWANLKKTTELKQLA